MRACGVIASIRPVREKGPPPRSISAAVDMANGTIDRGRNRHAPHSPEEKTRQRILGPWMRSFGVETQIAVMTPRCQYARKVSISDYVRWQRGPTSQALGLIRAKALIQPVPMPKSPWRFSGECRYDDAKLAIAVQGSRPFPARPR